jgi:hypothetical protein
MLTCFGMIWNYDKISKQNTKSGNFFAFSKFCIFSNFIVKKKWHIGVAINTIYNFFKKNSFENSSLGKLVFWEKKPQKGQ